MGRMKELAIEQDETARMSYDPHNEFGNELEFDEFIYADDATDWWRTQDADMTQSEFDALEIQAEIQEARTNGYL